MTPGFLVYKCRRCAATARNTHAPDITRALCSIVATGGTPTAWGLIVGMTDWHSCGDGGLGIMDLIGGDPDR